MRSWQMRSKRPPNLTTGCRPDPLVNRCSASLIASWSVLRETSAEGRSGERCSGFAFSQIAPGDFDVAVVSQLHAPQLSLGDQFEPGPLKMVSFEAPFGRRPLCEVDAGRRADRRPRYLDIRQSSPRIRRLIPSGFHRASSGNVKSIRDLVWKVFV